MKYKLCFLETGVRLVEILIFLHDSHRVESEFFHISSGAASLFEVCCSRCLNESRKVRSPHLLFGCCRFCFVRAKPDPVISYFQLVHMWQDTLITLQFLELINHASLLFPHCSWPPLCSITTNIHLARFECETEMLTLYLEQSTSHHPTILFYILHYFFAFVNTIYLFCMCSKSVL